MTENSSRPPPFESAEQENARLREENARLRRLMAVHGIPIHDLPPANPAPSRTSEVAVARGQGGAHSKAIVTTDSDHGLPVYPNLTRTLTLTGLDQLWVSDITYIRLDLEFVYLAVILAASRFSTTATFPSCAPPGSRGLTRGGWRSFVLNACAERRRPNAGARQRLPIGVYDLHSIFRRPLLRGPWRLEVPGLRSPRFVVVNCLPATEMVRRALAGVRQKALCTLGLRPYLYFTSS